MEQQKIFGIYIRVSTEQQFEHGDSVEMQENLAKNFIKEHEGVLYKVYIEGGVSASKTRLKDRKVLLDCLNDARDGLFNNLIVYRRDRLARKTEDSLAIRSMLEEAGCSLYFTATGEMQMMLNDPYGKLMENIRSSLDEIESAQISVRVSDTMFDKAKRGEFTGGNVTYGYKNENGYLKPIESEIPTIREVEGLYLQGYGKHTIIKWLEGEEVKGLGSRHARSTKLKQHKRSSPKWTIDTINAILFNKTYSGYMVNESKSKGETAIVKSEYIEPIRSEELQQRIDRIRASKNEKITPPRRYNTPFLLTGVMTCSECGREFASRTVTKKNGKRYSYYICKGRAGRSVNICQSKTYKKDIIEQFVLEESKQYIYQFINEDVYLKVKGELEQKDNSLQQSLNEVGNQLKKKTKDFQSIQRLLLDLDTEDDMYEMMRDTYQEQQKEILIGINNLKKSKKSIEEQLEIKSDDKIDLENIISQLKDFNEVIDEAPPHLQKQLLDNLFSKIELDKHGNVKYSLSFAIENNDMKTVGFSVLGLGGVGDTTTPKNITIQSDETDGSNYFAWMSRLVNFITDHLYTFITEKNANLKSPDYFSKQTGMSRYMHKEYRLYGRIPSSKRLSILMGAANTTIDDFIEVIRKNNILCNHIILKNILDESNVVRRHMRRHLIIN